MSIFSRERKRRKETETDYRNRLAREMVESFGNVCSLMTLDSFCKVISVLIEHYRMENDVTVGQLRYQIEQTYSQMTAAQREC